MRGNRSGHHTTGLRPIFSWVENYSRRQQFQRMAKSLLAEKDDIISDLGYDRREIAVAMKLPLRNDATQYLEKRRSMRTV